MVKGHGTYTEIVEEEFLPTVTSSKLVLCHFYHNDFERCKIIDHHLRIICKQHPEARFLNLNAEKSPFFITKLQIKVLPTIICFIDGIAVDRVVGFSDLGNKDDFPTIALTKRLINSGVLKAITASEKGRIVIKKGKESDDDVDDDY
jgi:thioredoxin-like negative regulator of GroEL